MTSSSAEADQRMVTPRFLLVTAATLAYYTCVGILIPTLPVFIKNGLGSGEAMIGASAVLFSGAAVLFRPLLTWVGNRWGRRTMMVSGALVATVAALGMTVVNSPWQLLPFRALMGVGEAALFVGAAILVVELSPENRKAEAASYLSVAVFGGLSVGPIIGELVMGDVPEGARGLSAGHFDRVFIVTALASLLAAAVSLTAPAFVGAKPERIRRKVSWFHPRSLRPGMILALGMAAWTSFTSFVPTFSKSIGLSGSARFFTVYSILCLVLRLFGAKTPERLGLRRSVWIAMSFLLCGVTSVGVLGNEIGIWIGTTFFALGISFFYPSLLAMAVEGSDSDERVEVVASFTSFFEIGGVIGGLALGGIGQLFGERSTFFGGMVFAVMGLLLLRAPSTADQE
ncbi:MAG: MFS transporter [Actinomycetes bacterium]